MCRKLLALTLLLTSYSAQSAISYIASDTDHNNSANSLTLSEPTGTAEDDLLIAMCKISESGTWTDPTDFTELDTNIAGAGINADTYLGYKVRGATAGQTLTFSSSATAATIRCIIDTYRGINTASPFDVTYSTGSHYEENVDDGALNAAKPITTVTDNAWVLLLQYNWDSAFTAGAPTGYTIRSNAQNANRSIVTATKPIPSNGTETPGVWTHTSVEGTVDSVQYTLALEPASTGPVFTVGPTISAVTNGYNVTGTITCTGTCTVEMVCVNPAAAVPTSNQIEAGQDGSSVAAPINASEVWTTGVSNDFDATLSGAWPRHDCHVSGTDGTDDTSVTSSNDLNRSADSGEAITVLTSVSSTSVFALQSENTCDTTDTSATVTGCADTSWLEAGMLVDLSAGFADLTDVIVESVTVSTITFENAANSSTSNITVTQDTYFSPTVATGDVIEGDTSATCTGGSDTVTWEVDGDFSYTATTCGSTLTELQYNIQDVSDASDGDFDTGPPQWTVGDDSIYLFNSQPNWEQPPLPIVLTEDQAMSSIDVSTNCLEPDSQTKTIAVRTGTVPNGTTISSAGVFSGTPDTEDESGETLNLTCNDPGELYDSEDYLVYVVNTVTLPTLDDSDLDAAVTDMQTAFPWRVDDLGLTVTFRCDDEALNQVISQSPAASTEVTAFQEISIDVSVGPHPCALRRRMIR